MIPSGQRLIVSDAFVVLLRSSGMWGFPSSRVFLDFCANSREPCIMRCGVGSPGGALTGTHVRGNMCITRSCDHKADVRVCGRGGVCVCICICVGVSLPEIL